MKKVEKSLDFSKIGSIFALEKSVKKKCIDNIRPPCGV